MGFPLLHLATMKSTSFLISKNTSIIYHVDSGNILNNMDADRIGKSHGYDCFNDTGNILEYIKEEINDLLDDLPLIVIDKEWYAKKVRFITHYVCDVFTVGQICGSKLWGKKDNLIDTAMELVPNKNKYPLFIVDFNSLEDFYTQLKSKMFETKDIYYKDTQKWFSKFPYFPTPNDVTNLSRRCVCLGASYVASLIKLIEKKQRKLK